MKVNPLCFILVINFSLIKVQMSFDNIRKFLLEMQRDNSLREKVISSSTADDVALIALERGYEFSGDELLRFSGNKVDKVTVRKNDVPGEYN